MVINSLLATVMIVTGTLCAEAVEVVLQNEHLAVTFKASEAGPRLAQVKRTAPDRTCQFEDSHEISLFVVRPESIHNPQLQVQYALQDDFRFEGLDVDKDGSRALFRFHHDLVEVEQGLRSIFIDV